MESSELFFPIGSLELTKEQSAKIKSSLGQSVDSVPIFRVVPVSGKDSYLPLSGVPGLSGMVGRPVQESFGGQIVASLVEEMARGPAEAGVFAAHTKLMAPHPESEAALAARPSAPAKAKDVR